MLRNKKRMSLRKQEQLNELSLDLYVSETSKLAVERKIRQNPKATHLFIYYLIERACYIEGK